MPESEGIENYVVNDLFDDLLDTIVQGLCFEVHRAHKNGRLFLDEGPQVRLSFKGEHFPLHRNCSNGFTLRSDQKNKKIISVLHMELSSHY